MSPRRTAASGASRQGGDLRARRVEARVGDRHLRYAMYRLGTTLALERRQQAPGGVDILAVLLFDDPEVFKTWWQDDALRFDHPLLHQELRRDAAELWEQGDENP